MTKLGFGLGCAISLPVLLAPRNVCCGPPFGRLEFLCNGWWVGLTVELFFSVLFFSSCFKTALTSWYIGTITMKAAATNAHPLLIVVHTLNPNKSSTSTDSIDPGRMQTKRRVKHMAAM